MYTPEWRLKETPAMTVNDGIKREMKEYIKSFSRNDTKQNYIALWGVMGHNLSSTTDHFSAGRLI